MTHVLHRTLKSEQVNADGLSEVDLAASHPKILDLVFSRFSRLFKGLLTTGVGLK